MVVIHSYIEHYDNAIVGSHSFPLQRVFFKNRRSENQTCFEVYEYEGLKKIKLSYYIGLDWIDNNNAIYVEPKVNNEQGRTDYLKMLYSCLKHPEVVGETEYLYQIQFDKPPIEIEQKQDVLTPLLVIHFLQVVRTIVKKGLKRDYYSVEKNLNSKAKGKILINKNLKQNVLKNKLLKTVCYYDEFGFNTLENRLIKRALRFIQRYVAAQPSLQSPSEAILKFCMPAFELVDEQIELNEIKGTHINSMYKEYAVAIKLAKIILKRFGYNLNAIANSEKVNVPPFWVDMSRLFELYVLGKLKDRFGNGVTYRFTRRWNELDYLLDTPEQKMIIDAKYKLKYNYTYDIDDIRQLSGYARLSAVASHLNRKQDQVIDCLIIYPDQSSASELPDNLTGSPITGFTRFYKVPISLPVLG